MAKRAKTGGRVKGTPNAGSGEARTTARRLLKSPTYMKRLGRRLRSGDIAPQMEVLLWHYAFGKPTDTLDVSVRELTLEEIVAGKRKKE